MDLLLRLLNTAGQLWVNSLKLPAGINELNCPKSHSSMLCHLNLKSHNLSRKLNLSVPLWGQVFLSLDYNLRARNTKCPPHGPTNTSKQVSHMKGLSEKRVRKKNWFKKKKKRRWRRWQASPIEDSFGDKFMEQKNLMSTSFCSVCLLACMGIDTNVLHCIEYVCTPN